MYRLLKFLPFLFNLLATEAINREELHKRLDEVLDKIEETYPGEINQEELLKGMIIGVVRSVDKNADYISQDQLNSMQELFKGENKGLGITVEKCSQGFKVTSVFDNSNAAKEDFKSGDIIVQLDELDLKNISHQELIKKLSDERPYKIKLKRRGKILTKIISPAPFAFSSLKLEWIKDIAYIKVVFIHEQADVEMLEIIDSIKKRSHTKGVILDIRNVPGGSLLAAANIACMLLDGDLVVDLKSKKDKSQIISSGPDQLKNIPIVVLQNRNSCSAAEIISASLQASKRATIMGQNSAGAATGKVFLPLTTEKGALILTYAFLYDKNGKKIGTDGISPDILLKEIKESKLTDYDSQISESLQFLGKK
jgi:carboxyl-terminal processing protease